MLVEGLSANSADTNESVRSWLQAAGVSLATALLVATPFFRMGNVVGHDFAFHLCSWMEVARQWKDHIYYPRWTQWANGGFGEPRFIFYPPLSWMLGAALGMVASWKAVQPLFAVFVQTLAGLSAYALARRFLSKEGALMGAAFYAANPYALLDIYIRSAFGEQLSCALMPLVVLAALELSGLIESRGRSTTQTVAFFAATFAMIWLSDVPAAVMATYSSALVFAWAAVEKKGWQPLWRGAAGLGLGFGLSGFYLVPVAYEQHWINTAILLPKGFIPIKNFLYAQHYRELDLEGITPFDWTASNVAILMFVLIGIAGIAARRRVAREEQDSDVGTLWRILLLLSGAGTFLMMRLSWPLWRYLPKLLYVQFPWRWLGMLAMAYALYAAAAIEQRRHQWIWVAMMFVIAGGAAVYTVQSGRSEGRWADDIVGAMEDYIKGDMGYIGAPEYYPGGEPYHGNFYSHVPDERPRVQIFPAAGLESDPSQAKTEIEKWTAEEKDVQVTSQEPVQVELRLLNYPAWRVEVNGKIETPERLTSFNQIIVRVPAGKSEIRVSFTHTLDRLLGSGLSIVSILGLTTILLLHRLREQHAGWKPSYGVVRPTSSPR